MANSRLGQIKAKIIEHIAAMALIAGRVVDGVVSSDAGHLIVGLTWGPADKDFDAEGLIYKTAEFNLRLHGNSEDQIYEAMEALEVLWEDNTLFGELNALGVTDLHSIADDPPIAWQGGGGMISDMRFFVQWQRES